jgi:hypothetical protein
MTTNWIIIGLAVVLLLIVVFKTRSSADPVSAPGPSPTPAAGAPAPQYKQTMIVTAGSPCPDNTWTKIGSVTCAK